MKIVVFGGSGFVGSHVADALTAAGHAVTVFDLRPSPYLGKKQEMVIGDVLNEKSVREVVKGKDLVYNFAGFADIESAQDHPLETIRANILGNGIVLEAARREKVKRYLFASTIYVYSDSASFYRASKQACEAYIDAYQKVFKLPYTILRFGSLYGPRAGQHNGIAGFLRQAMKKKKIVYWGTGEEVREYIHVQDAARCCVDVLSREFENAAVILTGAQPIKVRDLLVMIREIMNNKVRLEFRPGSRPELSDVHYTITPYSFVPKEGKKLVRTHYMDLGQGLLSLLGEFYAEQKNHGTERSSR
jgi:UDP-glucose 4-epimerase